MDRLLLTLTDRVGDWLQEVRAVSLPTILFNVTLAAVVVTGGWLVVHSVEVMFGRESPPSPFSAGLLMLLVLLWLPTLRTDLRLARRYTQDLDRYEDDPDVRKRYAVEAVTSRFVLSFLRKIEMFIIVTFVPLVLLGSGGDLDGILFTLMFVSRLTLSYTHCINPKVTGSRRSEKSVPLEVSEVMT